MKFSSFFLYLTGTTRSSTANHPSITPYAPLNAKCVTIEIQTKLSKQTVRSNNHNEWQKSFFATHICHKFLNVFIPSASRNDNFLACCLTDE